MKMRRGPEWARVIPRTGRLLWSLWMLDVNNSSSSSRSCKRNSHNQCRNNGNWLQRIKPFEIRPQLSRRTGSCRSLVSECFGKRKAVIQYVIRSILDEIKMLVFCFAAAPKPQQQQQQVTVSRIIATPAATPTVSAAVVTAANPSSSLPQNQTTLQALRNKAAARHRHPAPLPYPYNPQSDPNWKRIPPRPMIRINNNTSGIVISWNMEHTKEHAEVLSYQIYAYQVLIQNESQWACVRFEKQNILLVLLQETSNPPSTETWRHVGDVKAMLLPMAVTLTQFQEGQKYHFAVRAVDEHGRSGLFSVPRTY